ncbi:hypothetical protein SDRG_08732 [Saprolegnia diclina VS20]|uniref:Uncharacterized protein n=1 Tax=Saprolegnia diclina (strain VS20) TaxID=1156394 RepID=T0RTJ3_SAPDV|nr:hypothetical protein SDRG_08732 [Saprolegnia diclina VS20]EQC33627.1 hypothetical protein SDRG_08732 [Saprolegnia diclina VS20]|eukprot:XP_008612850.1 hypothetical protein SDRG_08732 [Saprolegnia diclina VS20]
MKLTGMIMAALLSTLAWTLEARLRTTATTSPTHLPVVALTTAPTEAPTPAPTDAPTPAPTKAPTPAPTDAPTVCDAIASGAKFTLLSRSHGYFGFSETYLTTTWTAAVLTASAHLDGSFGLKLDATRYVRPNTDSTNFFYRTLQSTTDASDPAAVFTCVALAPEIVTLLDFEGFAPQPTPYLGSTDNAIPYIVSSAYDTVNGPTPDQAWLVAFV